MPGWRQLGQPADASVIRPNLRRTMAREQWGPASARAWVRADYEKWAQISGRGDKVSRRSLAWLLVPSRLRSVAFKFHFTGMMKIKRKIRPWKNVNTEIDLDMTLGTVEYTCIAVTEQHCKGQQWSTFILEVRPNKQATAEQKCSVFH